MLLDTPEEVPTCMFSTHRVKLLRWCTRDYRSIQETSWFLEFNEPLPLISQAGA